jgi:hypothetical protein
MGPAAFDVEVVRQAIADGPDPSKVPLTVDTMREVDAAIRQIRKIATGTLFVMKLDQRMTLDELLADINSEAAAATREDRAARELHRGAVVVGEVREAQAINAALTDPQYMFERLGRPPDFFWGGWTRSRDARRDPEARHRGGAEALGPRSQAGPRAPRELLPEDVLPLPKDVNRDVHYRDRNWLLMVALNMGNASNKERLLGGYGWKEKQVIDALQKHLTHGEMEFVQKVWNLLNKELYPALAEALREGQRHPAEEDRGHAADAHHRRRDEDLRGRVLPGEVRPDRRPQGVGVRQEEAAVAQLYGAERGGDRSWQGLHQGARAAVQRRGQPAVVGAPGAHPRRRPLHRRRRVRPRGVQGHATAPSATRSRSISGPSTRRSSISGCKVVASARAEEAPKALEGALAILQPLRNRYMTAVVGPTSPPCWRTERCRSRRSSPGR